MIPPPHSEKLIKAINIILNVLNYPMGNDASVEQLGTAEGYVRDAKEAVNMTVAWEDYKRTA